jgi:hypothetical protein
MLLLDKPMRLSTDIDILVKPGTDIDAFISRASEIFPFVNYEEQTRRVRNNITKKHYMFYYESPVNNELFHIILDVVFEINYYSNTVKKEINNILLDTEPPHIYATVPSLNCILGDKLTAFAPHTIGILYGDNKNMEIIKQVYDIASLVNYIDNFEEVKETYRQIAGVEINNRNLVEVTIKETLNDSFNAAISIVSKGTLFSDDYEHLLDGMRRVKNHIFYEYSPLIAERETCLAVYLITNVLADSHILTEISDEEYYADKFITNPAFSKLNYIKKDNLKNFAYLYESIIIYTKLMS